MSAKHWALSGFFVWHLTFMVLVAFGSPDAPQSSVPPRHPDHDPVSAHLTPLLDQLGGAASHLPRVIDRLGKPLQPALAAYLEITGLSQNWKMFSSPPRVHEYLRVRYYVGPQLASARSDPRPTWTATELVLPAHREDGARLLGGYQDSFRDKAVTVALQRFRERRNVGLMRADTTSAELPEDLAPIARYFARRFEREFLRADERVLRSEVWYGVAPMPPPGSTLERTSTEERWTALRRYYDGPVQNHIGRPLFPAYGSGEKEGNIVWWLEYLEP